MTRNQETQAAHPTTPTTRSTCASCVDASPTLEVVIGEKRIALCGRCHSFWLRTGCHWGCAPAAPISMCGAPGPVPQSDQRTGR